MVDIEKVNPHYEHASPIRLFRDSFGRFACDLLELTELQAKLLRADARSSIRQSTGAIIVAVLGCCCLLGCLPVMVFGIAAALSSTSGLSSWLAQLVVGGCLASVSVVSIVFALRRVAKARHHFSRSASELSRNIEWTKRVIRGESSK